MGRVRVLGLAYNLTGEARYARRAIPEVEELLESDRWRIPKAEALGTGEALAALGLAYDWLYDALGEDLRGRVREAIVRDGMEPLMAATEAGEWWTAWYRCNWGSVIYGQAGVAALALLGDEPRAAEWARLCARKIWHYTYAVGRDGGWAESGSYATYAWLRGVLFSDALRRVTGGRVDLFDNPNLPQLAHWFIELLEPDETHFIPFSNCGGRSDEAAAILCRLAGEYQDGEVQWFVERMVGRRPSGDVLSFLWYDSTLEAKPPTEAPRAKVFASIDWAMLRSGWGDPKATVFALKGGQKDWDHQHHDTNHFVLYAQGRPLIVDLLYPHEVWGCETEAHNTIMVNGREQRGQVNVAGGHGNPRHRGVVADLIDAPWYTRLVGDASLAYEPEDVNSFVREVMYVRRAEEGDAPEYFVVFDEVEATGPSEMDWLVHTYGQVTVEGKRITMVQDEAAVDIALVSPAAFEWEVKEKALEEVGSDKPFEGADLLRWVRVRPAERVQRGRFLSVLRPRPASASPEGARVIALEEPNVVGARVEQEGGSDVVMFALGQAEMKGAGVEAVGRSCFVRRTGGRVRAAALHGGHRITADGALLFEVNGSGQAVLRFGERVVEGRFDLYDSYTMRIHSPRRPTKALVNGEESAFEYEPEARCVKLEGSDMREVRLLLEGE